MKRMRSIVIGIASMFFLSVIVFTNDKVQEFVPNSNVFLIGGFSGLVALLIVVNYYPIRKMIDKENEVNEESETPLSTMNSSIVVSLIMVLYSFIAVGSSINSEMNFLQVLSGSVRIIAIFVGLYLFYVNFYLTYKHIKLSKIFHIIITVIINILSILYFIFVSYWTIVEFL